jgi:YesN/AraC family two-component response regulator
VDFAMSENKPIAGARLLLADDDAAFREPFARLLAREGYECLCAADAEGALKLLGEHEVDALISDIHMPGNAGLELIQSAPQLANGLPVILMTGWPSVETAARSVRLSVIAYLVKPPDMQEVFALLAQAIPRYRHLRAVSGSRKHLRRWAEDLTAMEENLRRPQRAGQNTVAQDYLRVTLHNLILQLSDLDQSIAAWSQSDSTASELKQLDFVGAVRHTINVLEKTRQSFHSKDLGELRKQLQTLLPSDRG